MDSPSSTTASTTTTPPAVAATTGRPAASSLRSGGPSVFRYLFSIDTHTYAFSVAANAVLSLVPMAVLMLTLARSVFHSKAMYEAVFNLLRDYLPFRDSSDQEFIRKNLDIIVGLHKRAQIVSLVMLLITSTGVFLPLEVALNRIWGFPKNRSYLLNQLVSLGLAVAGAVLALLSVALTAGNQRLLHAMMFGYDGLPVQIVGYFVMKLFAILASIAIFFLIYWLLPHGRVPARAVAHAAVIVGLLWEASKYLYIFCLPLLDFRSVYGPFSLSVTLIIWAFLSGLLLLGGAHLSAGNADPTR